MQHCGDCTACCYALPIGEIGKLPMHICRHADKGCTIYKDRPQACKEYKCAWLDQPGIPLELRPDKCGVIFERDGERMTATFVKPPSQRAMKQIKDFERQGFSVVVSPLNITRNDNWQHLATQKT